MSGNDFKLAGSVGINPDPIAPNQQVMTQGIGFPLRPIDNVLPTDTPDGTDEVVEQGLFMSWMGDWQAGKYYARGSVVRQGEWTMVANTINLDPPAPVPVGNPSFGLPSFAPAGESDLSTVVSGHQYTFNQAGWIRTLRVWPQTVTGDYTYRLLAIDNTDPLLPVTTVLSDLQLTAGQWNTLALGQRLIGSGTVLIIALEALDSGSDTVVAGGWTYAGQSNNQPPGRTWNRASNHTTVRIDRTDADGVDRKTELLGIITGSEMQFVETLDASRSATYTVVGNTDFGQYVEYEVTLNGETGGGVRQSTTTTMTATIPTASATAYAEVAASVPTPSWATVIGYLTFDNVSQNGDANSYGVDIEFQPATISPNWDMVAFSTQ